MDSAEPERNRVHGATISAVEKASIAARSLSSIVSRRIDIQSMSVAVAVVGMAILIVPTIGAMLMWAIPASDSHAGNGEKLAHVLANNPPSFFQNLPMFLYPTSGIAFEMAIKVIDSNDDIVNVTWEWGDGSANGLNTTPPASTAVWVNQTHTWIIPPEPGVGDYYAGPYLVNITLDDGMGGVARTQRNAYVYVPPNGVPEVGLSAPAKIDPSDTALIVANASDPEGDPLTWTFVYNNSVADFFTEVFHTPTTAPNETVWMNTSYVFGAVGSYTVKLNVSDALEPNQVWPHNISFTVAIEAVVNQAPQLEGAMNADPESLIINATIGYLLVNFSFEAFDPDGDVLYADWDFGDGTSTSTNVSAGGKQMYEFVQQRNYTDTGEYNITVVIGDGRPGHNVSLYRVVQITSNNLPPNVVSFRFVYSFGRSYALPDEMIFFQLLIGDAESNAVEVVIDFGDNSSMTYYNLTEFADGNVSLTFDHSYVSSGEYSITIWYSDNKTGLFEHAKYYNATVVVKELPPVVHKYWDAWDYESLALLIAAIVIPAIWLVFDLTRKED